MQLYFSYSKSSVTVKTFYSNFTHCFHVKTEEKTKFFLNGFNSLGVNFLLFFEWRYLSTFY